MSTQPELTDELAEILAAVLNGTLLEDSPADPAGNALTTHDRYRAETNMARQTAALSVLERLGYVCHYPASEPLGIDPGGWSIEFAGREALAAREAAKEAARVQAVRAVYAAAVVELHNVADALDAVTPDDLAELTVELKISTKLYSRTPAVDAAKIATVDAIALAVLGRVAKTEATFSVQDWMYHKAEERRGPVHVEVSEMVADPKIHERETEVERLRAEVAELRRLNDQASASPIAEAEAASPPNDRPDGAA